MKDICPAENGLCPAKIVWSDKLTGTSAALLRERGR